MLALARVRGAAERDGDLVISDDRGDGGGEAERRRKQRLRDAGSDDGEARVLLPARWTVKLCMMPHTVPKRPMNGEMEPTVARNGKPNSMRFSSRFMARRMARSRRARSSVRVSPRDEPSAHSLCAACVTAPTSPLPSNVRRPAAAWSGELAHLRLQHGEADGFFQDERPAADGADRQQQHDGLDERIGVLDEAQDRKIMAFGDGDDLAKLLTCYFEISTLVSELTLRRERQSSTGPDWALHSRTSLTRKLPMASQLVPSRSKSLTVRFDGRSGARSSAKRRPMMPSGLEHHEIELVGVVRGRGRIGHDDVGAAALLGRLELVELERDPVTGGLIRFGRVFRQRGQRRQQSGGCGKAERCCSHWSLLSQAFQLGHLEAFFGECHRSCD